VISFHPMEFITVFSCIALEGVLVEYSTAVSMFNAHFATTFPGTLKSIAHCYGNRYRLRTQMFLDIPNMRQLLFTGVTYIWLPCEVSADMRVQFAPFGIRFAAAAPATGPDEIHCKPSNVVRADVVLHRE
jgi:hypothetical protein